MQDNSVIYEIAKQIQDKNNMKEDISNAISLVSNMFKEKYMDKIMNEFQKTLNHIEENPTKEINLLNAIKPFLSNCENIENTINMLKNFSAINLLKNNEYQKKQQDLNSDNVVFINNIKEKDSSVKEDGVYDIDENCLFGVENFKYERFNPLILILFIMLFNN